LKLVPLSVPIIIQLNPLLTTYSAEHNCMEAIHRMKKIRNLVHNPPGVNPNKKKYGLVDFIECTVS
jgi:hypothetical protein